eukprot:COSAG01_NODE_56471_length_318_cov_0.712329_1_plen_33_part_10
MAFVARDDAYGNDKMMLTAAGIALLGVLQRAPD